MKTMVGCLVLVLGVLASPRPLPAQPDTVTAVPAETAAAGAAAVSAAATAAPDTAAAAALLVAPEPEAATAETAAVTAPASAPVFLGGREVFRVRVAVDGLSPAERAAAIRRRLNIAVADRGVAADSARLRAVASGVEVRLGRHFLWLVAPGDLEARDPATLAAALAELPSQVRDGVERERAGRTPLRLLLSVLLAIVFTLAAWALFRMVMAGGVRWRAWLQRAIAPRLPALRLRDFEVLSQPQLAGLVLPIVGRLDLVALLLLLYAYLTAVFWLFPWTQGWSWLLLAFARERVLELLGGIGSAIPGLLTIAIIFVLFNWLVRIAGRFFDAIEAGTLTIGGLHRELARPSKRLVRLLLWVVAIMVAYPYIPGAQTRAVQGVSILLGVMVSLGSTGVVGNMIAGLVLTYSRSFRLGDRVRIGDHIGDVVSLGTFATKVRTVHNEEVTIPNGQVAATAIVNYTRLAEERGLVLHSEVTIGYDVEWRTVHELLIESARRVKGIEPEPAPWVFQRSLNDYHVSYELCAVTRDSHGQLRLYSDLHAEIQDAFNRAGIEILSPAFHALRDAHAPVLPAEPSGPRPAAGAFRVSPPA